MLKKGENETFIGKCINCVDFCPNYKKDLRKGCHAVCHYCQCDAGYLRNNYEICVPEDQCEALADKGHEAWDNLPSV